MGSDQGHRNDGVRSVGFENLSNRFAARRFGFTECPVQGIRQHTCVGEIGFQRLATAQYVCIECSCWLRLDLDQVHGESTAPVFCFRRQCDNVRIQRITIVAPRMEWCGLGRSRSVSKVPSEILQSGVFRHGHRQWRANGRKAQVQKKVRCRVNGDGQGLRIGATQVVDRSQGDIERFNLRTARVKCVRRVEAVV